MEDRAHAGTGLTGALSGVRVLDLSRLLPGPYATMILADMGATVDKVEDPRGGDYLRFMPPKGEGGVNPVFEMLNRGKRSVVLDLKREGGRDALKKLVARADVLVESFRPGVLDRLGLGHDDLKAINPRLIVCAITGYGQDGPLRDRAGHDLNYLARAGVMGFTGPAGDAPQVPGVQIADIGGGALYAVIGILAALQQRERTGEGAFVDIAMTEGALSFAAFGLGLRAGGLVAARGEDMLMGGVAVYGTYRTRDGRFVSLASLEPKFWTAFCNGVGIPVRLEALAPGPHQPKVRAELEALFAERTRDEWAAFGAEHDCCLEPVLDASELMGDPQHQARGVFADGLSSMRTPVAPACDGPAPKQGQQSEAILREAGLSADDIAALRAAGTTR